MNSQLVTNGLKILVALVAMYFIGLGTSNLQWTGKIEKGTTFTPQDSTVATSITKNKNEQALQVESTVKQKQVTYSNSKTQHVNPFSDDLLKAQNDTALKLIFTGLFLLLLLALLPGLKDFNFLNLFSASFQDRVNTMQQLHNDAQQTLAGTLATAPMLPIAAKTVDARPSTGITEKNSRKMTATAAKDLTTTDTYLININIISTDPEKPLKGGAIFHLTKEYPVPDPKLFIIAGKAEFQVKTKKGFLLKVEVDDGQTELEFDLTTILR